MESKETAQMLLNNIIELKDTLSTLNERSKNYYDLLAMQERRIKTNEDSSKDNLHRIEKLEIALANLKVVEDHSILLKEHDKDIAVLKRDRYWVGILSGVLGSIFIPLLISSVQYVANVLRG